MFFGKEVGPQMGISVHIRLTGYLINIGQNCERPSSISNCERPFKYYKVVQIKSGQGCFQFKSKGLKTNKETYRGVLRTKMNIYDIGFCKRVPS